MAIERETHRIQGEQEIFVCPPTTFGEMLMFDDDNESGQALFKSKVHILRIPQEQETRYLALVDLKLKKDSFGMFLHRISPHQVQNGAMKAYFSTYGVLADWEMPDLQRNGEDYQRLLRIHKQAFPIEWEEFEKDRRLLISTIKGHAMLFPLISWRVDSTGKRTYDLSTVSSKIFEILKQRLSFSHQLQIILTQDYTRAFNPNIGLVAAAYLQPQVYRSWQKREHLPHKKDEDYKGALQLMAAAQVPLLVLWRKEQILAGKVFDVMENYANS